MFARPGQTNIYLLLMHVKCLSSSIYFMDCRVHRCDGTQQLRKEGWYLELHKRIFILDMGWTNMRALKGDSPEILKRPFFWKVED